MQRHQQPPTEGTGTCSGIVYWCCGCAVLIRIRILGQRFNLIRIMADPGSVSIARIRIPDSDSYVSYFRNRAIDADLDPQHCCPKTVNKIKLQFPKTEATQEAGNQTWTREERKMQHNRVRAKYVAKSPPPNKKVADARDAI